ncbi:MAG: transaldolase family protein [Syntrophales bacterium]|nr:transaldolase family protein [Syntrophales bacterium]
MRPQKLATKIFLDGGNPAETAELIKTLGFLDGQTTNPTLISKNPEIRKQLEKGSKFNELELLSFYKNVVGAISSLLPEGSISIEVYGDPSSSTESMLTQGKEMFSWIPNGHIKFPISYAGLEAAELAVRDGLRVNMTLCFSQEQAAAVYAATRKGRKGNIFISPFVGRLDDRGENGMDLIVNILNMYKNGDGHVEVLTASVRNMNHFQYALKLGTDIVTAPYALLKEWGRQGLPLPGDDYRYETSGLRPIPYHEIDLGRNWKEYDIMSDLTAKGMIMFTKDWNSLTQ